MEEARIAAIVVSFNRRALLEECLEALLNQTRPVDAIFVVDNGSADGSREYLASMQTQHDKLTVIFSEKNLGGAGGFSTGLIAAYEKGYDWYWLMDDDAEPMRDAAEKLLSSEDAARKEVVGICGAVWGADKQLQRWNQGTLDGRMNLSAPTDENFASRSFKTDYMSFVGACVRHEAVQQIGFPLKEYFVWTDDVEYTARLTRIGEMRCIPAARMLHKDTAVRDLPRSVMSFRKWYQSRKMPANAQWKYACGMRNYVDMVFRHRRRDHLWAATIFAKRLARILIFGERNSVVLRLYLRYYQQAIGRKSFDTVLPADWKVMLSEKVEGRSRRSPRDAA
jgi:rhamnopyranosyl-N-acetylglucosaminyl-diphospho-decaprenol beta-1,3/1,4-galactofuranosyltransferase